MRSGIRCEAGSCLTGAVTCRPATGRSPAFDDGRTTGEEFPMGFRRRTRRRGLLAGAVAGGAMTHHHAPKSRRSRSRLSTTRLPRSTSRAPGARAAPVRAGAAVTGRRARTSRAAALLGNTDRRGVLERQGKGPRDLGKSVVLPMKQAILGRGNESIPQTSAPAGAQGRGRWLTGRPRDPVHRRRGGLVTVCVGVGAAGTRCPVPPP